MGRDKGHAGIKTLAPRIKTVDARAVRPEPKHAEAYYLSAEHKAWREAVITRAGGRCQAIEHGVRCIKAAPRDRVFADHIVERRDGGNPTDVANGQCLCGKHHSLKTAQERAARLGRR